MAAPSSWHRRFEALVSVGPSLLEPAAAPSVVAALGRGLAVAVVARGRVAVGRPLAEAAQGATPLLLASADGTDRLVVADGAVRRDDLDLPAGTVEAIELAARRVLDELRDAGLPVEVAPSTNGCTARFEIRADREDDVRHALAASGFSGRVALADRVDRVARSVLDDVHVGFDDGALVVSAVDISDALRWVRRRLFDLGLGPSDVLVVTEGAADARIEHLVEGEPPPVVVGTAEAGPVVGVIAEQVSHRDRAALPRIAPPPGWRLVVAGTDPELERARSVLVSLADGRVGIGGAPLVGDPQGGAWSLVAGVYVGDGPETHLLPGPVATRLAEDLAPAAEAQRTLDLRTGVLHERAGGPTGPVDSVRFTSLHQPGTVVLRAAGTDVRSGDLLLPPAQGEVSTGVDGDVPWMAVAGTPGGIVAAATEAVTRGPDAVVLDRVAAFVGDPDAPPDPADAVRSATAAAEQGFDHLFARQRAAWAARWREADVEIDGDEDLQLAVRFSLFHLMGSVASEGEAAVGARGVTGPAYRGHVFWDADTFVLPFFAATHPASARAMLEYRLRRLDAARAIAARAGRRGARFPWESARTGADVTPSSYRDRAGRIVPIRSGTLEEHIVGQVAWAASTYLDWTGDRDFASDGGLRLFVETARYWASRARWTADGRAHLLGVIGPDEYHDPVDDNAFTNVLARWNLRRAAVAVEEHGAGDVTVEELTAWRDLADALVDGYHPSTGVYEQFAGFSELEPLVISEVAPRRPIVAELLLGRERVQGAQVVKQADVLMLHHLIPDDVPPGSLEPNLRYYEPRTAHGSSLSPAIHASLLARTRDFDRALDALRLAARIDLDDLTLTTAGGLHLAAMGGVWQALVHGFAGLRPSGTRLGIDPRLPPAWHGLGVRVRFRDRLVQVRIQHDRLEVRADRSVGVVIGGGGGPTLTVDAGGVELARRGPDWEVVP